MNLTLPILDESKLSLLEGKLEKLFSSFAMRQKPKPVLTDLNALMDKKGKSRKLVAKCISKHDCNDASNIPVSEIIRREFEIEETEVLKPPWRLPLLVS